MVVLEHVAHLLLRSGASLLGLLDDQRSQFFLAYGDFFTLGELIEDDLCAQALFASLADLFPELVCCFGLFVVVLQVLVESQSGVAELLLNICLACFLLVCQQLLGKIELSGLDELLQNLLAGVVSLLQTSYSGQAFAKIVKHLVDGVELADHLSEVIVQLGELLVHNLVNGYGDVCFNAAQFAADQGGLEGLLVASLHAFESLVETIEHATVAQTVLDVLSLAFGQRLAVLGGGEVEHGDIALGELAVYLFEFGKLSA